MIRWTYAGITVLLSLWQCDVATNYPVSVPSAYSCERIYTGQVVRWDGRDSRTRLWIFRSKEVWDIDANQMVMLDEDDWRCIIDRRRNVEVYYE